MLYLKLRMGGWLGIVLVMILAGGTCVLASTQRETDSNAQFRIYDLTIDGEGSVKDLGNTEPVFSWKLQSEVIGERQTGYQVVVYRTADQKLVWDSGRIHTDQSRNIRYEGEPLEECTSYNWTVQVWDQDQETVQESGGGFETTIRADRLREAKWIRNAKHTDPGDVVLFRRPFSLKDGKTVEKAYLYTTALGIFDVFLNGERVGYTGEDGSRIYDELKPGWTDYSMRCMYYTYDITDYLMEGKNVIASEVAPGWYAGEITRNKNTASFSEESRDLAFLCMITIEYADGSKETVITDDTWETSGDGPYRFADLYDGEWYDAEMDAGCDWLRTGGSGWEQAVISEDFKGMLNARLGARVTVRDDLCRKPAAYRIYAGIRDNGTTFGSIDLLDEPDPIGSVHLKADETLIVDLGQNMVGFPAFTVQGRKKTTVKIRFAEMLNDSGSLARGNDGPAGSIYRANYRTAKASLHYVLGGEPEGEAYRSRFVYYGFRYMEVTATDDICISEICGHVVTSVGRDTGYISTSNADVNQLFGNIRWGQYGNFISVPTDCPQRDERLGWTGDFQIFAASAAYNADMETFMEKWIEDSIDNIRKYGMYQSTIPTAQLGGVMAGWSDAGVTIPYLFHQMYGDTAYMKKAYPYMKKYIEGLGENGNGYHPEAFGDWLASDESTPVAFCNLAMYSHVTHLMSLMAGILGKPEDEELYRGLSDGARVEFQRRYVDEDGSLKVTSQCAYLMALSYDLLPNEKSVRQNQKALRKAILENDERLSTGFLGTAMLETGLSRAGLSDLAYDLLLQTEAPSWLYCVRQGASTVWERWDSYTEEKGFGNSDMNSFNHYAFGCVAEWMYADMAGIRSGSGGFQHFLLSPQIDGRKRENLPEGQKRITHVNASYDSCYGRIRSSWNTGIKHVVLKYQMEIPANTSAEIVLKLPKGIREAEINGERYKLQQIGKCPGLHKVCVDESEEYDTLSFEAEAGAYMVLFPGDQEYAFPVSEEWLETLPQDEGNRQKEDPADVPNAASEKDEVVKTETAQSEAVKTESEKTEAVKTEDVKTEAAKTEAAKTEVVKTESAKTEAAKTEAAKGESVKTETAKNGSVKTEAAKGESVKTETAKSGSVKTETAKNESVRVESAKSGTVKTESAKSGSVKTETAKGDSVKTEAAKNGSVKTGESEKKTANTKESGVKVYRPDHLTGINLPEKATCRISKKITVKDADGIQTILLNGHALKCKKGKKKVSFKLIKYKRFLKKKGKWNRLAVRDLNGRKKSVQFKIRKSIAYWTAPDG